MVSKCANPGCSNPFLYWRQGKLFRIEISARPEAVSGDAGAKHHASRVEFFWLCATCAPRMTVSFEQKRGIIVTPVDQTEAMAS